MAMSNRDSRFEILRVVAIFFVVVHHLLLFGADQCGYLSDFSPSASSVAAVLINSVVVTGVSLFVMITGWFGARCVWRPMARLVVECAFFGVVAWLIGLCLQDLTGFSGAHLRWGWRECFNSMKFTNWWFMAHYLMLLLWAPLLEAALKSVDRRGMERIVLCLLVFNVLFGYFGGYVNASGYNVIHFILLYVIARYMRLYPEAPIVRFIRVKAVLLVAACALSMTLIFLLDTDCWYKNHTPMVWNYNDPLVILEAVAIFSLFTKVRLQSARVNFVARYVLGIYLLQSAPAVVLFRNAAGHWAFAWVGYAGLLALALAMCLACWAASWAIMSALHPLLRSLKIVS